jgi:hypothetical protein
VPRKCSHDASSALERAAGVRPSHTGFGATSRPECAIILDHRLQGFNGVTWM